MKKSYVRQMFYIKITTQIRRTQEVVVRGNGEIFSHQSGKNGRKNRMMKNKDLVWLSKNLGESGRLRDILEKVTENYEMEYITKMDNHFMSCKI